MNNEIGRYQQLWKKYVPVIKILLKKSLAEEQRLALSKREFEVAANKIKYNYQFTMEIEKGKVQNDIRDSAVAIDLMQLLNENGDVQRWLIDKNVKMNMSKGFELILNASVLEPVAVAADPE